VVGGAATSGGTGGDGIDADQLDPVDGRLGTFWRCSRIAQLGRNPHHRLLAHLHRLHRRDEARRHGRQALLHRPLALGGRQEDLAAWAPAGQEQPDGVVAAGARSGPGAQGALDQHPRGRRLGQAGDDLGVGRRRRQRQRRPLDLAHDRRRRRGGRAGIAAVVDGRSRPLAPTAAHGAGHGERHREHQRERPRPRAARTVTPPPTPAGSGCGSRRPRPRRRPRCARRRRAGSPRSPSSRAARGDRRRAADRSARRSRSSRARS
jgi:hypothetical protein